MSGSSSEESSREDTAATNQGEAADTDPGEAVVGESLDGVRPLPWVRLGISLSVPLVGAILFVAGWGIRPATAISAARDVPTASPSRPIATSGAIAPPGAAGAAVTVTSRPNSSHITSPAPPSSNRVTPTPTISTGIPPENEQGWRDGGLLDSLPSGSWVTVLESLPKATVSVQQALKRASDVRISRADAIDVLDTDTIKGFTPGYWALAVIGSTSKSEARELCEGLARTPGPTCYPRQVG